MDRVLAVFAIADAIRPESFDAVKRLHNEGLEVVLLTGDSTAVAERGREGTQHRHRLRRGIARGQGGKDRGAAGPGQARRDGG
ncbi:HAD family hydrolase [Rhodanobacter lindaniclasticus]